MDRDAEIGRLCRDAWILLILIHPERARSACSGAFRPYRPQSETLPHAASSVNWYRGWREHLDFAEIEP